MAKTLRSPEAHCINLTVFSGYVKVSYMYVAIKNLIIFRAGIDVNLRPALPLLDGNALVLKHE